MADQSQLGGANDHLGKAKPPRLIRLPEVMDRVGLRRTAIYERMKAGTFPKSRSLGPRCSVWVEAEIDEFVIRVDEGADRVF